MVDGTAINLNRLLRLVVFAATALAGSQGLAGAATERFGPAEGREIRAVIEAQLRALGADDGALALSYASPSIQMQFGDARNFMAMVREGYPMLIRPSETLFPPPHPVDGSVIQTLHLRDQEGRAWRARYHMLRQPDGSWRINGCVVDSDRDGVSM